MARSVKNFKIRVHKKTDEKRKGVFWFLTCSLFVLSTLYVYYVNTAAMNGVKWEEAARQSRVTESAISDLEATYLSEKRTVTLARATELGFESTRRVTFLTEHPIEVSVR